MPRQSFYYTEIWIKENSFLLEGRKISELKEEVVETVEIVKIVAQPMYDKRRQQRLILILETINQSLSSGSGGHTVLDSDATIEHIMPQSLDDAWKAHLGENWDEIHRDYVHTLGNLTIVTQEWNSSLSNSSFERKKDRLANHALLINSMYFSQSVEKWDSRAIEDRAQALTDRVLQIWVAFGEPPSIEDVSGRKPYALILLGESHDVNSWRDVAFKMAEVISELADNFDAIAEDMGSFFSREERKRSWQMGNGWWIYINLSSSSVVSFCERLTSMVGLSDDDWEILLD